MGPACEDRLNQLRQKFRMITVIGVEEDDDVRWRRLMPGGDGRQAPQTCRTVAVSGFPNDSRSSLMGECRGRIGRPVVHNDHVPNRREISENERQRLLLVQCGKIEYKMNGMADRDFPKGTEPPKGVEFTDIDSTLLRDMIEKTIFAVCRDETRYTFRVPLFTERLLAKRPAELLQRELASGWR